MGRGGGNRAVLLSGDEPLDPEIEAFYDGKADSDRVLDSVYYQTAKRLVEAYVEGYEKPLFGPDWTVKDTELLNRVQNNLFSFSAAKSYAEAKEIRDSVYDRQTGKIRSRNDFRRACRQIDATYNGRYLDVERQQVMLSGTQGSRWVDFENSADTHPYLEYVTARDEHVREEHRTLDGIILPIDDPFWKQYYPPNGWKCRCTVRKRTEREYGHLVDNRKRPPITDSDEARKTGGASVSKAFRHNVGTSYIFDKDDHPYYKANAAGKAEQMTAQKHYGMKSIEQIYLRPDKLAGYKGRIKTKEDYDAFWDDMEAAYGEAGKGFTLVDEKHQASATFTREQLYRKLRDIKDMPTKKHPEPQRRWSYFDEILEVFYKPDEVWNTLQHDSRSGKQYWAKIYLRYYKDMPTILFVNESNMVASFYKSNDMPNMERVRNGLLIQRKKR